MTTYLYTHPSFLEHDTGTGHPECADRLVAIEQHLAKPQFNSLNRQRPIKADLSRVQLVHSKQHVEAIVDNIPADGRRHIDGDTVLSPGSLNAALYAVGAVCDAIDAVLSNSADNAFCAVRPPGHHAEPDRAMGFCLFNNIAIGAAYALSKDEIKRVAIVDFDVHHGNGTQAAFENNSNVLYISSHQMPLYPGTGSANEHGVSNILNCPLAAGSTGKELRECFEQSILPKLSTFNPDLLLISAGFDAHKNDPLAQLNWVEDDYRWITRQLVNFAKTSCQCRLVSALEGGYHLQALAASVGTHIEELLSAGTDSGLPA